MSLEKETQPWQPEPQTREKALRVLRAIARFHRHRAVGMEHIPKQGPTLIVVNHSLATYDISLLGLRIYEQTGRFIRGLGDRAIFRTPIVGPMAKQVGVVQGSPKTALELLKKGELVVVAPGGMREALRSSRSRYQVLWQNRKGFARLAVQAGCPVVLAACPRADDIYQVRESRLTRSVYKRLKLPIPIATGLGPTLIPKPVPLTHWISEPLLPPIANGNDQKTLEFQRHLRQKMEKMMSKALFDAPFGS
jgi:1-acyl-sn-glycerol-3-phosphate acyltransferase